MNDANGSDAESAATSAVDVGETSAKPRARRRIARGQAASQRGAASSGGPRARRLPRSVALWMEWVVVISTASSCSLGGCAATNVEAHVQADHAVGESGASAMRPERPLAVQGGARTVGSQVETEGRAADQAAAPVMRRARSPWVGSVSVPMGSGERLPSIFTEPVQFNFDDGASGGKVGLRTVADRITAVTGVPVRIKVDVFGAIEPSVRPPVAAALPAAPVPWAAAGGLATVGSPLPMPSIAAPSSMPGPVAPHETSVNAVAMRWSGPLEGYLDLITDQLNLSWEYRDGVVVIERLRTEFFEVAALDGDTDYKLGLSGADQASATSAGSGSGGGTTNAASANSDINERGHANAIASILAAIRQIVQDVPGSSAVRSDGSGRVAVTSSKEALSKVRDFVRVENESLLRQAQVQFDIYSVTRRESDERGIEWNAVVSALGGAYKATFGSPSTLAGTTAANIGFAILTPADSGVTTSLTTHLGGSTALLKLLNEYGVSTQHREVSLLALNRTWDRKSSVGGRAYVSSTIPGPASTTGVGAPGLVTSTVTTGDRYLAQPFILDNNTVLLKFGIGLSSLVDLANFTSGTGVTQQTVQTPETTAIDDQATVALKAGQILVITGLSRIVSGDARRTLGESAPVGLGGSSAQSRMREEFVIFVRPTIL
jgi:type IVB pilus formation R64 PilN family outer membrane protein